jgi:hypothetical protein
MNTPLDSAAHVPPGGFDALRADAREHAFAALGLGAGIVLMMVLDTALG